MSPPQLNFELTDETQLQAPINPRFSVEFGFMLLPEGMLPGWLY
jgi:hypothetical protein